tara:strand:+ start:12428 stop:12892 length:465 start_codon:yes stop_codon:yes gene_type:complete
MKIHIWIKKEDAISGNIKNWYTYPVTDYVQVSITQDKFARLNDQEYCQDNWNRGVEKINSMFDGVIHERNPDTGQIRSRKAGDYGNEVYHGADKGDEDMDEGESKDYTGTIYEAFPEYKDMKLGNFQGWYSKLTEQDKERFDKLQRGVQDNKRN